MFQSSRSDFDSPYWTRTTIAMIVLDTLVVGTGVIWLVVELFSRVMWYLLAWMLSLLYPSALILHLSPNPTVVELHEDWATARAFAAAETAEAELDLDMGDFDFDPTPDPLLSEADLPPDPSMEPDPEEMLLALDSMRLEEVQMIGILGALSNEGALMDVLSSEGFGDLDSSLGDLIGAGGGLEGGVVGGVFGGVVSGGGGLGGGGTVEGLGGLGTIGYGGGGTGEGTIGSGSGRGRGRGVGGGGSATGVIVAPTPNPTPVVERVGRPKLGPEAQAWVRDNGATPCTVRVEVDDAGRVSSATVDRSCPSILQSATRDAALAARFKKHRPGRASITVRSR